MSLDEFESKFSKTIQETEYKHLGFEFMIEEGLEGLTKVPSNAKKIIRCKESVETTLKRAHLFLKKFQI